VWAPQTTDGLEGGWRRRRTTADGGDGGRGSSGLLSASEALPVWSYMSGGVACGEHASDTMYTIGMLPCRGGVGSQREDEA